MTLSSTPKPTTESDVPRTTTHEGAGHTATTTAPDAEDARLVDKLATEAFHEGSLARTADYVAPGPLVEVSKKAVAARLDLLDLISALRAAIADLQVKQCSHPDWAWRNDGTQPVSTKVCLCCGAELVTDDPTEELRAAIAERDAKMKPIYTGHSYSVDTSVGHRVILHFSSQAEVDEFTDFIIRNAKARANV